LNFIDVIETPAYGGPEGTARSRARQEEVDQPMTRQTRGLTPEEFRAEFPSLRDTVHLASCSQGAVSVRLEETMRRYAGTLRDRGAAWDVWMTQVEEARERFARLINADPDEIAVVPSASAGAFQAASSLDWTDRPGLLSTPMEFPSVAHVWHAQHARGARVGMVRDNGHQPPAAEDYADLVDASTGLVSVPLVCYRNGARPPVREITALAHAQGARVFVDAYQGTGVLPVDVRQLDCDYLVSGALKYLLGLPGVAFLYVRAGLTHPRDPELTGWFGRRDPYAFDPNLLDFPDSARRFESGTPSVPSVYAANAGMDMLDRIDPVAAFDHVSALVDELGTQLLESGERLAGPAEPAQRGPQVALRDAEPDRLAHWLGQRRIVTAARGDAVRLSFHYYNDRSDVAAVVDALRAYRKR
jgi:selenocysteine lyase/cysteine desulfurase